MQKLLHIESAERSNFFLLGYYPNFKHQLSWMLNRIKLSGIIKIFFSFMNYIWNFKATVAKNFQMQMEENYWLFLSFFFMFSIQDNWFLKLGYYLKKSSILFFATDLLQNCRDFCYSYRRQLVSLLPGSVIAAWAGKQGCLHKKGGLRRHVISVLQIYTTFAKHTWVWEQEWMQHHSETTLQIYCL